MPHTGARFEITGTDPARRVLRGTGDPALDARGRPERVIYVDILDPATGRTWFGATRRWSRQGDGWHWSLDLSLAADTEAAGGSRDGFGKEAGAFEITAYYEEPDPATGRVTTQLAAPYELTIAAETESGTRAGTGADPDTRTGAEAVPPTDSISIVLSRIREMSERRPARGPVGLYRAAGPMLPEDRFVFAGRTARALTG